MTRTIYDFNSGSEGASVGTIGSANFGTQLKYTKAASIHGAMGIMGVDASGNNYGAITLGGLTKVAATAFVRPRAGNTSDWSVFRLLSAAASRLVSAESPTTTYKWRTKDGAAANGTLSTTAMTVGKSYAVALYADTGSTTSNGTIIAAVYDAQTEALIQTFTSQVGTANAGGGTPYQTLQVGQYGGDIAHHIDTVIVDDNPSGLIWPFEQGGADTVSVQGEWVDNTDAGSLFGTGVYTLEHALSDGLDTTGFRFADCTGGNKTMRARCAPLNQHSDIVQIPRARLQSGSGTTYMDLDIYQGAGTSVHVASRTGLVIDSTSAANFSQVKLTSGELANITFSSGVARDLQVLFTVRAS